MSTLFPSITTKQILSVRNLQTFCFSLVQGEWKVVFLKSVI